MGLPLGSYFRMPPLWFEGWENQALKASGINEVCLVELSGLGGMNRVRVEL